VGISDGQQLTQTLAHVRSLGVVSHMHMEAMMPCPAIKLLLVLSLFGLAVQGKDDTRHLSEGQVIGGIGNMSNLLVGLLTVLGASGYSDQPYCIVRKTDAAWICVVTISPGGSPCLVL